MTTEAITSFIFLSEISFDYGITNRKIFYERIENLYQLNGLNINDYYFYRREKYKINDSLIEGPPQVNLDYTDSLLEDFGLDDSVKISNELYSKDNTLHLIPLMRGKYCRWEFHQFDKDDKPSVPHGHSFESTKSLKLDPYRSRIFNLKNKNVKTERENDDYIKQLWNDNAFRILALDNISYHINTLNRSPRYWSEYRGLSHSPLRLPRRK